MYSRTLGLVASASLFLLACGGDSGTSGPQCMGTEISVPGQANDPCPQNNAMCVAAGGKAYATCENGQWKKTCDCITGSGPGATGSMSMPAQTQATCGDTVITPPSEACDRTNLNGATCQSLGFNGGGTLLCNSTTCNYDTIMCRMTTTTSSGAGTSGGAGNGGGGTGT